MTKNVKTKTARKSRPANAKLTSAAVRAIRRARESNKAGVVELARKYGVHHSTIQAVVAGETYR